MNFCYDKTKLSTKVFDFLYGCSMHDAILQQAFKGEKAWVGKVEQAKPFLRKYITYIVENRFSSQGDHDAQFLEIADNLCKEINSHRPKDAADVFSFGNAQKLINIAAKHAYSVCYWEPHLRENFRYCHCPLDSIMLQKVWKLYKEKFGNQARKNALESVDAFCKAWGNEGQTGADQPPICDYPERYLKFQQAIKTIIGEGDLYPIEFDYLIW